MSEFAVRLMSGIVGVILLIVILYFNGIWINLFALLLSIIAFLEISKAFKNIDINIRKSFGVIISIFSFLEIYYTKTITYTFYAILLLALFDLLVKRDHVLNTAAFAFSSLYIILGFSSLVLIENPIFIGLVFLLAFSSDTFAYLVGVTIGKHKLIPDVSPNKSIEGAIGGIIGTCIMTILYLSYFNFSSIGYDIIVGVFASIFAQAGDLVASRIKRDTGIKDFGKLIPGHGGVLDRFDSVLLVAPIVMHGVRFLYKI